MDQTQLRNLIAALLAQAQAGQAGQAPAPAGAAANPLQILLGALLARQPAGAETGTVPPILSPIDNLLGGQALAGKKTALAVVAFAILSIIPGGAAVTGAPAIIGTLIKAFGGLGLLAKFDRVIQSLGLIAAAPGVPAAADDLLKKFLAALAAQKLTPPAPLPLPQPLPQPESGPAGRSLTLTGKMSTFGGPADTGVSEAEGLALIEPSQLPQFSDYFLPQQPPGTTGLARRLNPDASYIACRWDYDVTSKSYLRGIKVKVSNTVTGQSEMAQPIDKGPDVRTGRVADLSPGLARRLGLTTDQTCTVVIPL